MRVGYFLLPLLLVASSSVWSAGFTSVLGSPGFKSDIFSSVSIECESHWSAESLADALDADEGYSVVPSIGIQVNLVHGSTGVEKLHKAGIIGKSAVIAVVDSGVQYTHPALGGGIGPNYTVIGGYVLVGRTSSHFLAFI
ncbi:hypothetical protein F4811DRAFT_548363 [Daldinia bambusicola]|nr:hypothetical protein F4811DRAFT_548363 [Daldinia bambusicola]